VLFQKDAQTTANAHACIWCGCVCLQAFGELPLNDESMFQCAELVLEQLQTAVGTCFFAHILLQNVFGLFLRTVTSFRCLSVGTGAKTVLPIVMELCEKFLRRSEWRFRFVALMAAAQVAESFSTWQRVPSQYVLLDTHGQDFGL